MIKPKNILLQGRPGSGKTTLVKKIIQRLPDLNGGGFYTEEIRDGGQRTGFRIRTLDGKQAILAHTDFKYGPRVGKYGVDVRTFEDLVIPCLKNAAVEADLIVIDEIGKMELFSAKFRAAVMACIYADAPVLATIMAHPHPFADEIKMRSDVKRMEVTQAEQGFLIEEIIGALNLRHIK